MLLLSSCCILGGWGQGLTGRKTGLQAFLRGLKAGLLLVERCLSQTLSENNDNKIVILNKFKNESANRENILVFEYKFQS